MHKSRESLDKQQESLMDYDQLLPELCPNCMETVAQCACMRNMCHKCGKPEMSNDIEQRKEDFEAMYNKRTWLNKIDSPSLGNVVAFDGEVRYSDEIERTTFLAISDCSKTIKLIKNTENIEDFIDKMKLLKQEIELFINHLENKSDGTKN
jgi:hypothetical protein